MNEPVYLGFTSLRVLATVWTVTGEERLISTDRQTFDYVSEISLSTYGFVAG